MLTTPLSPTEIERYSRQLILKNWTSTKQRQLTNFHVLVPDCLPSVYLYLAAAGIGHLSLYPTQPNSSNAWLLPHTTKFNPEITCDTWPKPSLLLPDCQVILNEANKPELPSPPALTINVTINQTQASLSLYTENNQNEFEFTYPSDQIKNLPVEFLKLSLGSLAAMLVIKHLIHH